MSASKRPPVRTPASAKPVAPPRQKSSMPPVAPPRQKSLAPDNNILATRRKYETHGWTVMDVPRGMTMDLVAQHGQNMHFVQVASADDPRASGIPSGAFIQNAMSNGARPVRAKVDGKKVSLVDANLSTRVIIRAATGVRRD